MVKVTIEFDLDINPIENADVDKVNRYIQRQFVGKFNDYMLNEMLDDSEYSMEDPKHPWAKFKSDLKVVGWTRITEKQEKDEN